MPGALKDDHVGISVLCSGLPSTTKHSTHRHGPDIYPEEACQATGKKLENEFNRELNLAEEKPLCTRSPLQWDGVLGFSDPVSVIGAGVNMQWVIQPPPRRTPQSPHSERRARAVGVSGSRGPALLFQRGESGLH